jgi:predicted DNA-binding transcriptional regulator YafY
MRILSLKEKNNLEILSKAIDGLNTVSFMYKDENDTSFTKRTIEPFLIGDRKGMDSTQVSGWCLDLTQNVRCWRIYKLDIIEKITINPIVFNPIKRIQYKSGKDSRMDYIRKYI